MTEVAFLREQIVNLREQLRTEREEYRAELAAVRQQLHTEHEEHQAELAAVRLQLHTEREEYRAELATVHQQLSVAQTQLTTAQNQLIVDHQHYHEERMAFIGRLDQGMDRLLEAHELTREHISDQLKSMESRMTRPPDNHRKRHGCVLLKKSMPVQGQYQLRFVAGQKKYVQKVVGDSQDSEVLIDFRSTGNPIDLRNNFKKIANQKLRQIEPTPEVRAYHELT